MRLTSLAPLALAAALAACGGDGTGSTPTTPPSFGTSQIAVNFPENGTAPVTTLTINAEATANLAIQLSGPDASLFSLDASRNLRFTTPPDFETPRDVGANNVYNLTATAIDTTGASARVDIVITVTNDATATLRYVDPVFPATASLGTFAGPGFDLALIGPAGDTLANRPLVLVAPGGDSASGLAMANSFAARGYVAALVSAPGSSFADSAGALTGAVALIGSPSFDARGYGIDAGTLFIAGEGLGARVAGSLAVANVAGSPVRGGFSLGGGLFDTGMASGTSAVLFAAGDARQGSAFANAYRGTGVAMQFNDTGAGTLSGSAREAAIAGAAQLFHDAVLARRGL